MEILTLWELQSANVLVERSLSSILFIIYAIACFIKKEGCYVVAFLFDEIVSNLSCMDILTEHQYYLMITTVYCCLYWHIEKKNISLKTILACGIIVLFNMGMSVDAVINPTIETVIYSYYIYFILFLHLYLISTLFSWEHVRKNMGEFFRAISNISGTSDAFAFFWYNSIIIKKQSS